jgi:site-specific DNA-methyltransferase (adenine-specific)
MTINDLCSLPVQNISEDKSVLLLWATYPLLEDALKLIKAWGFVYKTCAFQWVKKYPNNNYCVSLGNYTRSNTEPCLLATKGKKIKVYDNSISQLIITTRERHSKKPVEVREKIVRVFGDLSRIELFSRDKIEGWDCWGNQVPTDEQRLLRSE